MTTGACASCGKSISSGEERRVPGSVVWAISIAFAFGHGGMWAKELMGKPFCARCVSRVVTVALAVSAAILAAAAAGLAVWLRGPRH